MGPLPNTAWLARLRQGDEAAFAAVYAHFRKPLYGFLRRAARRDDVAEDLFQETWMALARSAPGLREETDLAAWLFTVARNALRRQMRWSRLDVSRYVALCDDACATPNPGPEAEAAGARLAAAIERALVRLPASHREVLLLVGVQELEQEQVAEVLGISYAALRQRLARARAALAARLDPGERLHRNEDPKEDDDEIAWG